MYLKLLLSIKHHHFSKLCSNFTSITGTASRLLLLFLSWSSAMTPVVKLPLGDPSLQEQSHAEREVLGWVSRGLLVCPEPTFGPHLSCGKVTASHGLLWAARVKSLPASSGDAGSIPGSGRSPEEEMAPTPVFLPGKFHGSRSLVDCSPWACKE